MWFGRRTFKTLAHTCMPPEIECYWAKKMLTHTFFSKQVGYPCFEQKISDFVWVLMNHLKEIMVNVFIIFACSASRCIFYHLIQGQTNTSSIDEESRWLKVTSLMDLFIFKGATLLIPYQYRAYYMYTVHDISWSYM